MKYIKYIAKLQYSRSAWSKVSIPYICPLFCSRFKEFHYVTFTRLNAVVLSELSVFLFLLLHFSIVSFFQHKPPSFLPSVPPAPSLPSSLLFPSLLSPLPPPCYIILSPSVPQSLTCLSCTLQTVCSSSQPPVRMKCSRGLACCRHSSRTTTGGSTAITDTPLSSHTPSPPVEWG